MEDYGKAVRKSYLDIIYPQEEYAPHLYPQKLCDYISDTYFPYPGVLLDIGSGKGNHLVGFSRNGHEVYGLDKRNECIEILPDMSISECDIENDVFPFRSESFDWVFSKSVLEHVSNTDNFLNETLRILKPGGVAVLMTPAWESQYKLFWDDYTHVKAFTRKGLQNAMRLAGFNNVESSYFIQLPFIWKYPWLVPLTKLVALVPDSLKWKDKQQQDARKLIRFSKEYMIIAVGEKDGSISDNTG